MIGSFRGRGSFHPNITYFPSRPTHPNAQQAQQHSGSPMQSPNASGELSDSPHKQTMRRPDEEGDHLSEISDEGDDALGKLEVGSLDFLKKDLSIFPPSFFTEMRSGFK